MKLCATHDELTGCLNRAAMMTALEDTVSTRSSLGVVFVDLDDFKPINDRFGHATGDALLRIVAERLQGVVRDGDLVGRIGGDEFLVICRSVRTAGDAMRVAERIAAAVADPAIVCGHPLAVTASLGVSFASVGDEHRSSLVNLADMAMYESKREGRGEPVLARTSPRMA